MKRIWRGILCLPVLLIFSATVVKAGAPQYTFKSLYSFCAVQNCTDGKEVQSSLLQDAQGDLFGVTSIGGQNGAGTVFELVPNANKTKWKLHILYDFCALANCVDGDVPIGALIADVLGNLYGTTAAGGQNNGGLAFELKHDISGKKWHLHVLHNFYVLSWDGAFPGGVLVYQGKSSGAPYDGVSPLYGTTFEGGAVGSGSVFKLIPPQERSKWTEKVIYSFCHTDDCLDGYSPNGDMVMNSAGDLFGTTNGDSAVAFELSPTSRKNVWDYTVLHSFLDSEGAPSAPAMDTAGNLFGTLPFAGNGEIFKIMPSGESSPYSVIYTFCSQQECTDGQEPLSELVVDPTGNLFGTTAGGGTDGWGVVFKLNQTLQVLHDFTGVDGNSVEAGLILDSSGDAFGASLSGGSNNGGTIFELKHR
ncbi:MAG: choice-of-anchor tandem repeat GloVer-containing protein [Rhizomicrobium sp.]